jgi:carboxymethylenebutenolidase
MSVSTRYEHVQAQDGGSFEAFCAVPESGNGPGVLVFQEIFGINDNIRGLCERLADAGFVALAPDMFWRIEPRFERKDESGFADAIAMVQKFDQATAVPDITSTFAHLLRMPECNGKVGGVGFCLGGTLTYLMAATARADGRGPDAAVSYYGSGIHDMLDLAGDIECPIMFHYGDRDQFIPREQVDAVEAALGDRPNVTFHHYDAGHAFSHWDAPSMYDAAASDQAWERTTAFFAAHLASNG